MKRIKAIFNKFWKIIRKPEMLILPGNLAFFLVLSLIPIVTLMGIVASAFSLSVDTFVNFINDTIPSNITDYIIPYITGNGPDANTVLFMIMGFFIASNGPDSLIIASNILYGENNKSYLNRRIKALLLTVIIILLFVFILLVLAFGNNILKVLLEAEFLKSFNHNLYIILLLLRWPIAFGFIFFTIKLVYTIAPDVKIKSKYVNKGALFTTIGLIISTLIFTYYTNNIARYDIFYGGLSNLVIMMMYIYLISYIIVLGIAINNSIYDNSK